MAATTSLVAKAHLAFCKFSKARLKLLQVKAAMVVGAPCPAGISAKGLAGLEVSGTMARAAEAVDTTPKAGSAKIWNGPCRDRPYPATRQGRRRRRLVGDDSVTPSSLWTAFRRLLLPKRGWRWRRWLLLARWWRLWQQQAVKRAYATWK